MIVAACAAPPASSPCPELTRALCRGNVDCCDQPERRAADVDACMEDNLELCELVLGDGALGDGVVYDAGAVTALTALVEERAASCDPVPDLGIDALFDWRHDAPEVGLALAIRGAVPAGEACGEEGQSGFACVAGTTCVRDAMDGGGLGGLGPGTCEPLEPRVVGASCTRIGPSWCQDGARCASCSDFPALDGCDDPPGVAAGVCVAAGTAGADCGIGTCADGLWCDGWSPAALGTCVPAKPDGEACEGYSGECAAGHCEDGTCGPEPRERSHCAVWRGRIG